MQEIFSTQSSADYCRKNSPRIHYYFRIELFEKTVNKNDNCFHQRKAAGGDDAPRDQLGTVRLVSSISRSVILIGGRLVGWFRRLVPGHKPLAPVVVSYNIVFSSGRKSSIPLLMQPLGEVQVECSSLQGH